MSAPDVHSVGAAALDAINRAADVEALDAIRAEYLGRGDGLLTIFRKQLGQIEDLDARRQTGQTVNALCDRVTGALEERRAALASQQQERQWADETIDLTWPAPPLKRGRIHPTSLAARDVRRVFAQLGYMTVEGPEVEYDHYNFTLVNMPPGHPARDTQDTFYIDDNRLLRTQTTAAQIRCLRALGAPLRIIIPGKTFRRDYDATHTPMFFQVEGLCVDEGIAMSDLKGTLEFFARSIFGKERAIQLRPHHFPYTEPSVELDISCMQCEGTGCPLCKHTGWLELLGAGMVHPTVLRNGGIDPERYSGFAFGAGLERIAMLAYGVPDLRLLYENDVRLLRPA